MRRAALPARHPGIATSLHNLAVLYDSQDENDQALPLYKEMQSPSTIWYTRGISEPLLKRLFARCC